MRSSSCNRSFGKLDVGLVDFVDQQHGALGGGETFPELAAANVILDIRDARIAELAVPEPRHRVIFVQSVDRLSGRLDVPFDERRAERLRNLGREHGLAGARLALDQERALQRDGGIDGDLEVVVGDVGLGAFKTHANSRGGARP
jgi:hypothetical protein